MEQFIYQFISSTQKSSQYLLGGMNDPPVVSPTTVYRVLAIGKSLIIILYVPYSR